ncbi:MAG: VWA domain-containing protein [Gemmataceae bacterium]
MPFPLAVLFSTPAVAIGTAAATAAIPLIIHFLNRRRYHVVDWAAMRFLRAALKRTTRRMRLEQWLLLAVRTSLVLLFALAIASSMSWAEPLWQRLFPGAAPPLRRAGRTHHVIVLDGSLSMTANRDGESEFERSQKLATNLVRSSPGGDGFSVILMSAPPRAIVPGPAEDPARVAREISELHCTHGLVDLTQAMQQAEELLNRSPRKFAHRAVYFFTDLQRSQWSNPPTPTGSWVEPWQRLHARSDVAIVDVGPGPTANLAVASLELADPVLLAGSHSALTATVQNFLQQAQSQLRVELWQSKTNSVGRSAEEAPYPPRMVRQELLNLASGTSASVSFPVEFRNAGDYLLEVRLQPDALAADDRRALPVSVRESLPVLLVNGQPSPDKLDTATGWLATALAPADKNQSTARFPVKPRVIDESRFSDPDLDLNEYDCVYLCDVARLGPRDCNRLEAYVRRGGTVVFTLGPNTDPETYNRLLYRNGEGLLPARLLARQRAQGDAFFNITADRDAFRRAPLSAFLADDDSASLLSARFKEYWRVEPNAKATGRRILSFLPQTPGGDALIYDWPRGRGRVVLYTSTVNTGWTGWPVSPSFLPFMHELLRSVIRQPARRDLAVGEAIDEYLPEATVASEALISPPDGPAITVPLVTGDDAPRIRFTDTDRAGIYTAKVAGTVHTFAVNVPSGESALSRATVGDLPPTGTDDEPQVITDPGQIRIRPDATGGDVIAAPEDSGALGANVARYLLLFALVLLFVEPLMAWRWGSAREPPTSLDRPAPTLIRRGGDALLALATCVPLLIVAIGAIVLIHAAAVGETLEFLPASIRSAVEHRLGVPPAAAGEGTRWRIDRLPVFTADATTDRWLVGLTALSALALAGFIYFRELRRTSRMAGWPLAGLRFGLVLLILGVLLPQLRLIFEREGWPDLVVLIDDSQSMGVSDTYPDPASAKVALDIAAGTSATRLQLAQALLTRPQDGWLAELVNGRQTRLHVFRMSDKLARVAEIDETSETDAAKNEVRALQANGPSSRLGDAIHSVLQEFRGATLAGVIVLTDGITTDGEDIVAASRHAARSGVPLTFVGLGDAQEPRDLVLSDLRVDDVVHVGDRLVFEAQLTSRGGASGPVPIVLSERKGDQLVEVARAEVMANATGTPAKVRVVVVPREPGERTYVLEATPQPGEEDTGNNRLERSVFVTEFKRTRVLLIDGRPRYDYRAVKTLFERETEAIRGNKSVELKVLLLDADPDYPRQDRSALESFPVTRDDLFAHYDVVILGDVDPSHPELGEKHLQWLADFVRERGGGLLFECGPNHPLATWRNTPLASVLPADARPEGPGSTVRSAGYQVRLTAVGRSHHALRFAPDEEENLSAWSKLRPLYWAATSLQPKPAAEVLAELPASESGAASPLILQQFVGAGRVMLFGFEETWRWRYRSDEVRFNQFWLQMIRHLAQSRPGRAELRLDRQTAYRRGEPIHVTVRFPDDKPPPSPDTPVKVTLDRTPSSGTSERQTLQLAAMPGSRATYETIVTRTPEGVYHFFLVAPDSGPGTPPHADARVQAPPGEMDQLRMNRGDMEQAAQISRGHFYTLATASKLLDELPPMPRVTLHQPRPPRPIWNLPFMFLLTIGLITAEWALRKRQGLV